MFFSWRGYSNDGGCATIGGTRAGRLRAHNTGSPFFLARYCALTITNITELCRGEGPYVLYNNITITHFFFYEKNVSYTSRRALLCRFRVYPATCRGPRCIQTVETPAVIIIFVVGPLAQGVRRGIFLSLSLSHYIYIQALWSCHYCVPWPAASLVELRVKMTRELHGRGERNNNKIVNSFWVVWKRVFAVDPQRRRHVRLRHVDYYTLTAAESIRKQFSIQI